MRLLFSQDSGDEITPEEYIKRRGYVSYSSLRNLRDQNMVQLQPKSEVYYEVGSELHSRFLEKQEIKKFDAETEAQLEGMLKSLYKDRLVQSLLKHPLLTCEREFRMKLNGVPVLGYVDMDAAPIFGADLKTIGHKNEKRFIDTMDFLQPAMYCRARNMKDFYYIGISKQAPYEVFTFNARTYKDRMNEAFIQLENLLTDVKKRILND